MREAKIWFAWACGLSKKSVEPLYEAAIEKGYDCVLEARGRYDDLVERMKPFTHYVFGVGPDISWTHAKTANLISINIMHGQYIFGTWRTPIPDHIIFTGNAYIEDAKNSFINTRSPSLSSTTNILSPITYKLLSTFPFIIRF